MDEYIEREAALNIVNGWRDQLIPTYGKNDEYVKCLETVAEHLESLHAADVRPVVRGKWLHKEITDDFHAVGQCSVCKERRRIDNFCPNCGTDMRGVDNG